MKPSDNHTGKTMPQNEVQATTTRKGNVACNAVAPNPLCA